MVDTEFMRTNTFYPEVALLQLCFEPGDDATAWLIDPLELTDTEALVQLFLDPSILKVLHSPSEDMEVFRRWLGVLPTPLFDTQRAAALLDRGFGLGYRALVHDICGVDLPKGETRSNWLQRPLTQSQCDYAAQDVTWLYPVWQTLYDECQHSAKLDWVLADGEALSTAGEVQPERAYLRVKGAGKLDRRSLAGLQTLCEWREQTARLRNRPRNWILDDKSCLQLAQQRPADMGALRACVELPKPVLRRHGEEIVAALSQVDGLPEADLPAALARPLDSAQRDVLKKLKGQAKVIAAQLQAAPEVLLPSKDYELLVRESAGQPVEQPAHWQGWREEQVLAPLRKSLQGDS